MTALKEYDRIEATGLWRATPQAQRREVIVSIGNATLTITDHNDSALAHWSLPAIVRANAGSRPAIFHPDGDTGETLELGEDEGQMIDAIEKLRARIERARPHPGRLRLWVSLGVVAAVVALGVFWLPSAARDHALRVVPDVKRAEIGSALLARISRVTGLPCTAPEGARTLRKLGARLPSPDGAARLVVLPGGVLEAAHLPGGVILLGRALIEDYEEPDVVAGYIIAEHLAAELSDPLRDFLDHAGLVATLQLLTTGAVSDAAQDAYAEHLLTRPRANVPDATLLAGFKAWSVRARPYAYARDITGEETLTLIEADPFVTDTPEPLLSDNDWLRLQGICGS
ncbi:hypothetical protein [Lentibacter sp. XHP0401]|uniref:hypothetical protein n=1 Tax=Lentibacter sp. XHP0401 TaxID=2984334 RepID=UPI0021E8DF1F|nr:hypothetical protein [Lentibacter sp. XHP0401]MCV2893130.1 hypothetical protein [Lentibacter sp. XHP0401]